MPTGYTAKVQKGISFEEYALDCARAFGALVTMRDEPSDKEIPEKLIPDDYHLKAKVLLEEELSTLKALTEVEADKLAFENYITEELRREDRLKELALIEERYNVMLSKVESWVAPTKDHDNLKEFMTSQLVDSIDFDCGTSYSDTPTIRMTGTQYRSEREAELYKEISYHLKSYSEEVKRTDERNKWIEELRNSLVNL